MKVYCFFLFFIISFNFPSQIQNLSWIDVGTADNANHIIDKNHNIIVYGDFYLEGNFGKDTKTQNISSKGEHDIFIQKLDSNGNQLWLKTIASEFSETCTSVAFDKEDNLYVLGSFWGELDFDPGAGITKMSPKSYDFSDCYILKLDKNGNFLWVKTFGGNLFDNSNSIIIDLIGNIYLSGSFYSPQNDLDPSIDNSFSMINYGYDDIFITKLNSSGDFIWSKPIGGSYTDRSFDLKFDKLGNIYMLGMFHYTGIFNSSDTIQTTGPSDYFVQKISPEGDFLWTKIFDEYLNLEIRNLELDSDNNIFVSGTCNNAIQSLPPVIVEHFMFIQKLDNEGNVLFNKRFNFEGLLATHKISCFESNLYISGFFDDNVNFGDDFNQKNFSVEDSRYKIFILKLDSLANFNSIFQMETGYMPLVYLSVDENIYLSGTYSEGLYVLDKNGNDSLDYDLSGNKNYFALKLGYPSNHLNWQNTENVYNIHPNPTDGIFYFEQDTNKNVSVDFFTLLGEKLKSIEVNSIKSQMDITDFSSGIYLIKVNDGGEKINNLIKIYKK